MKTTLDLPDQIFRKAKSRAAERGESLKQFVTDALAEKLASGETVRREPAWMQGFGKLRRLHRETARVQARIDEAFETIDLEDRE